MKLFSFIDAEKANFPVAVLCKVLKVSRSGYYGWRDRTPSRRSQQDAALIAKIYEIHQRSRQTYGSPRIHAELRSMGIRCGRKRVARLMRREGLSGCIRGPKKRTLLAGTSVSSLPRTWFGGTLPPLLQIGSGQRILLMSVPMKAFCTWHSSSTSTPEG